MTNYLESKRTRRQVIGLSLGIGALSMGYLFRQKIKTSVFDMAFVVPCSQTDKHTQDFIESYPELITVYTTLQKDIIPYYTQQKT